MNNINRHNYESYFLLYIDNELSVTERKAVDEFVQGNPDLRAELVMLQQSILQPDHLIFEDKERLLQNESAVFDIREKLLLYLDDELLPVEKKELDALIATNAAIDKEWDLLQLTKLIPDKTIIFADKGSLYRNETGRVVAFPWKRVLAAAVLTGFGIWGGLVYFNNDIKVGERSIARDSQVKPTLGMAKPATTQSTPAIVSSVEKEKELAKNRVTTNKATIRSTRQLPGETSTAIVAPKVIQALEVEEKSNHLPKPYLDNINKIESNKAITAYVTPEQQSNTIVNAGNNNMLKSTDKQDAANMYAATTSFTDNSEENNDRVLFMDEEKIKKTKVGGMFRKVKRVIERNTNIKSGGNVIKVANLEFAIQ